MRISGLNNQTVRQHNRRTIMTLVWRYKRLSKSQLAQHTGLSIPAVSKILDELVSNKKLSHSSENLSTRGINSGHYQIPREGPLILCMNVSPTSIESQLIDARMLPQGDFNWTEVNAPTPDALLRAIEKLWQQHHKQWPGRRINLALGIHGQVDTATGVSQTMPQAPWKKPVEIKYLLEEKLGITVMVDNDCVMLALAEKWQNPLNREDFCVINVDYGIGSSFVINGQIYRGTLNGSGQIGHTIFDRDGMACSCGRYGCLETVASLSALKKQARIWHKSQPNSSTLNPDSLTSLQLLDAWRKGDTNIQRWVEQAANAIGLTLYNLLNIVNINQIWFYGRSCAFGEPWLQTINRQIGFTPFDHGDAGRTRQTEIGFGGLTRQQQITGIGYLFVEDSLAAE
ncbi:ROK family protein [Lelliottia sp.]|uniref:ROK family protein n=1 Tax=Lelliottia sp. TaxID=1898429 RepID=UPI00388E3443